MAQVDRALGIREKQLIEGVALLTKHHGAQSETVGVLNRRIDELRKEMNEDLKPGEEFDETIVQQNIQSDARGVKLTIPKVKDSTQMFVIIGGIIIFAIGGMSTMFILMIALGFGKSV